jgi:hypothetical protein
LQIKNIGSKTAEKEHEIGAPFSFCALVVYNHANHRNKSSLAAHPAHIHPPPGSIEVPNEDWT